MDYAPILEGIAERNTALTEQERGHLMDLARTLRSPPEARPLKEWHEDYGPVTWWAFPVMEPSWIGKPDDSDWPGYHTHWTPHPPIPRGVNTDGGTSRGE
jgi:hypothetical protein